MSDVEKKYATGAGAINESLVVEDGKTYQLISVSLKVDVAPTTSESFVITRGSAGGAVYDVPLYTLDLSIIGVTSIVWQPDQPLYLVGGDSLDVAWTNTDDRQWGLEYTVMRVHP
jgi:hypothetical protein